MTASFDSVAEGGGIGEGTCFKEFSTRRTWEDAQAVCKRWGGHLAVLDKPALEEFVHDYVRRSPCEHGTSWEKEQTACGAEPTEHAWVGLASFEYPTLWMWRRKHRAGVQSVPPYPHQDYPQEGLYAGSAHELRVINQDNSRRCAVMARLGMWEATACSDEKPFICERRDMQLASMSHTTHYETCGDKFHQEGCEASATHLGFSKPERISSASAREAVPTVDDWDGDRLSRIEFPGVSGKIITTGNLQDVTVLGLEYLNVTGDAYFQSNVILGTSTQYPERPDSVQVRDIAVEGYDACRPTFDLLHTHHSHTRAEQQAAKNVDDLNVLKEAQRGNMGEPQLREIESLQVQMSEHPVFQSVSVCAQNVRNCCLTTHEMLCR